MEEINKILDFHNSWFKFLETPFLPWCECASSIHRLNFSTLHLSKCSGLQVCEPSSFLTWPLTWICNKVKGSNGVSKLSNANPDMQLKKVKLVQVTKMAIWTSQTRVFQKNQTCVKLEWARSSILHTTHCWLCFVQFANAYFVFLQTFFLKRYLDLLDIRKWKLARELGLLILKKYTITR